MTLKEMVEADGFTIFNPYFHPYDLETRVRFIELTLSLR